MLLKQAPPVKKVNILMRKKLDHCEREDSGGSNTSSTLTGKRLKKPRNNVNSAKTLIATQHNSQHMNHLPVTEKRSKQLHEKMSSQEVELESHQPTEVDRSKKQPPVKMSGQEVELGNHQVNRHRQRKVK